MNVEQHTMRPTVLSASKRPQHVFRSSCSSVESAAGAGCEAGWVCGCGVGGDSSEFQRFCEVVVGESPPVAEFVAGEFPGTELSEVPVGGDTEPLRTNLHIERQSGRGRGPSLGCSRFFLCHDATVGANAGCCHATGTQKSVNKDPLLQNETSAEGVVSCSHH
jgi:hypothetical protein